MAGNPNTVKPYHSAKRFSTYIIQSDSGANVAKAEDAIQSEVVRETKKLYPHIRIFSIRNENNYYKSEECDIGHPDLQLEVIYENITFILKLELKTTKGKLNENQKKWNERFDSVWSYNCIRRVAYGTNQALEIIDHWMGELAHQRKP